MSCSYRSRVAQQTGGGAALLLSESLPSADVQDCEVEEGRIKLAQVTFRTTPLKFISVYAHNSGTEPVRLTS